MARTIGRLEVQQVRVLEARDMQEEVAELRDRVMAKVEGDPRLTGPMGIGRSSQ